MHIGAAKIVFRLPENDSLKGKRRAVQSLTTRLKDKFNISVAEVETQDEWHTLTLGICCVSNDGRHANSVISNVMRFLERITGDLELWDYEMEIIDGP